MDNNKKIVGYDPKTGEPIYVEKNNRFANFFFGNKVLKLRFPTNVAIITFGVVFLLSIFQIIYILVKSIPSNDFISIFLAIIFLLIVYVGIKVIGPLIGVVIIYILLDSALAKMNKVLSFIIDIIRLIVLAFVLYCIYKNTMTFNLSR